MKRFHFTAGLSVLSATMLCTSASAFFHAWVFTEFFSNADGSVQFIEMHTTLSGETQSDPAEIRTASGKLFEFPSNLSGSTANMHLLIATAGFGSLPGSVAPDFPSPVFPLAALPTKFFDPAGDTVRLYHPLLGEFHSRTFTSVPTDGVTSLNYPPPSGALLTNTPTNFSGASGSVNVSSPSPTGDYNDNGEVDAADYVLWRETLNQTVTAGEEADGNKNGTIDAGDYDYWRERFGKIIPGTAFGNGVNAVPEPATIAIGLIGLGWLAVRRSRVATQFAGATWNAVGGLSDADEARHQDFFLQPQEAIHRCVPSSGDAAVSMILAISSALIPRSIMSRFMLASTRRRWTELIVLLTMPSVPRMIATVQPIPMNNRTNRLSSSRPKKSSAQGSAECSTT